MTTDFIKLNKINNQVIKATEEADTWKECADLFLEYGNETNKFRNVLLSKFNGKEVTLRGHLVNKTAGVNYVLGLVQVIVNGNHVGTVQHLCVYVDAISNSNNLRIGGNFYKGEGKYNTSTITEQLWKDMDNDIPYTKCQEIEVTGTVYKYRGKYSVGTERQIAYARRRR